MATTDSTESSLKMLAEGRGRIAIIYDAEKGWCVTDDMDVLPAKMGPQAPEFRVIAYKDWFCKTLDEAVEMLGHIHVLRSTAASDQQK